jgi:phosphatidylserine decarboxylase
LLQRSDGRLRRGLGATPQRGEPVADHRTCDDDRAGQNEARPQRFELFKPLAAPRRAALPTGVAMKRVKSAHGLRAAKSATIARMASERDMERIEGRALQGGATVRASGSARRAFLAGIPAWDAPYEPKTDAAKRLRKLIAENDCEAAFVTAIRRVANDGIPELNLIHSLDQFYFYIDTLVRWIPEIRVWEDDGQTYHERTVYLRIVQLYYYFNQPELGALQNPVGPTGDKGLTPLSRWLRDFAVEWGGFLDTEESAAKLESFLNAPEYTWQDYEKAPHDYATFNEFFARRFRDIDVMRPVARKDDDRTIVFPAESTFVGQWAISTPVTQGPKPLLSGPAITVKHIRWQIAELLDGSPHASAFAGGLFCHSFLNTYDYHRLHAPVAGKVLEARFIPGQVYLKVDLKKQSRDDPEAPSDSLANAIVPERYLDADDPTGYQFVQCRGLLVLDTPRMGKVAVLPMGMAQVSSVVFTDPRNQHAPITLSRHERATLSYEEQVALLNDRIRERLVGQMLEKGEMFSFFQFGGSDCVVVFERSANVAITAARAVHYPIRSQYGVANHNA